jgi:hypothetical protein
MLLKSGLQASSSETASSRLDATAFVRVLQEDAKHKVDKVLADGRRQTLHAAAELAQRLPTPFHITRPNDANGAHSAERFSDHLAHELREAAAKARTLAKGTTLGRTLLEPSRGRSEWDLLKALDGNLRNLERTLVESAVRESTKEKQRVKQRRAEKV